MTSLNDDDITVLHERTCLKNMNVTSLNDDDITVLHSKNVWHLKDDSTWKNMSEHSK